MKKKENKLQINNLFNKAVDIYKKNWKQFILIGVILGVAGAIGGIGNEFNIETGEFVRTSFGYLMRVVSWLATTYLGVGVIRFTLDLVDGKKPKLDSIFHGVDSVRHLLFFLIVSLLTQALIVLGLVLFIIPGVIIGLGLVFTKYYIAENRGEVFDTIKYSWEITKGYKWQLLCLSIVIFLFNLLGVFALFIGLIVTVPISSLVMASAYRYIENNRIIKKSE